MDAWDMSDEQLEQAFLAAKQEDSPEVNTSDTENYDDQDNLSEGSDHDGTEDTDVDEEEVESNDTDSTSDESTEVEVEQPTDTENVEVEDVQPVQKYKYKANGKEYEFTADEIMKRFPQVFGQAMDYTRKMQQMKPYRKTIDAIEQAKLSHDDVNLMIDVLRGDKAAIAAVLKRTGVDTLDLDTEGDKSYVPNNYGRDESALAIKDVVDEISQDQEYVTTQSILSRQWDDSSWSEMSKNPKLIRLLHTDVKSGMYDLIQPIAEKLKLYDGGSGKSDLEYYRLAAQEHFGELRRQEVASKRVQEVESKRATQAQQAQKIATVKQMEEKRRTTEAASIKRKAAAPTTVGSGKASSVTDYLEGSDEDFDSWYNNLKDSQ